MLFVAIGLAGLNAPAVIASLATVPPEALSVYELPDPLAMVGHDRGHPVMPDPATVIDGDPPVTVGRDPYCVEATVNAVPETDPVNWAVLESPHMPGSFRP